MMLHNNTTDYCIRSPFQEVLIQMCLQ